MKKVGEQAGYDTLDMNRYHLNQLPKKKSSRFEYYMSLTGCGADRGFLERACPFLFASEKLKGLLESAGLPSLPMVPISSSQAVIGAIMGIALIKSLRNVNFRVLGKNGLGWICTPVIAGLITYILLFFMQNVFMLKVYTQL